MSKSRHHRGLLGRHSGTVTVIEDRVYRSSVRNAKITFWVALVVVGLVAASVAADTHHPIVALFIGAGIGILVAAPAALLVAVWPVLRVLWWWTPEIALALLLVYGWAFLVTHTPVAVRLLVLALVVGVPAGVPKVRRLVIACGWCLVTRHRIRTCFAQFIITNRTGSLPLILVARPIPVGERLWVWLRPGLCLDDLQGRLEEIAVACWAATVTVEKASESNAALVRLDVKRRDALKGTVASPLVEHIDPDTPRTPQKAVEIPTALDLPDVAADTTPVPAQRSKAETKKTQRTETAPVGVNGAGGDDLSDWLD